MSDDFQSDIAFTDEEKKVSDNFSKELEAMAHKAACSNNSLVDPDALTDKQKKNIILEADEKGMIVPKTIDEEYRLCQWWAKSTGVPKRFQGKPMDIVVARQQARELGLPILTALRQIANIQGTPCIFGDLPLSLIMRSGLLADREEYYVDKDDKKTLNRQEAVGAYCRMVRKGSVSPVEELFTIEDAKVAGLYPGKKDKFGNDPVWKRYTADMLKYRARARVAKDLFADVLNGMAIAEYDFGVRPDYMDENDLKTVNETTRADEISDRLKRGDE